MSTNGSGHRWSKFWWQDWQNEVGLKLCSLSARGLWMAMLCIAHDADGYVLVNGQPLTERQLAAFVGCSEREVNKALAELEKHAVFSRTEDGVIYCRRMVREAAADGEAREAWKAYGESGGNPQIIRGTVDKAERQRHYRRSDSPRKTERIFQRDGGRCHWCSIPLVRDNPRHPQFFHVDHIVAVRDGGGTDEANLVAACQKCNMDRARNGTTGGGGGQPTNGQDQEPYTALYRPPGSSSDNNPRNASDNNPAEIPTATLGTFRQQPSRGREKLEADSEAESKKESESFEDYLASLGASARGGASNPTQIAVGNVVGRVTRSLESSVRHGVGKRPKLSVVEQIREVVLGPILEGEVLPPEAFQSFRPGPVEPQRTVAEQLAELGFPQ